MTTEQRIAYMVNLHQEATGIDAPLLLKALSADFVG